MDNDHYCMGLAIEEARKAYDLEEVPVGAVLVDSAGQILAAAHNRPVSSSDPTAHAEILAIRAASALLQNYRLPETTLYVTLEPCAMCLGAMLNARVKRLVFGASDPRSGSAGSVVDLTSISAFNHSIEVTGGILAEEAAQMLKKFFRERRGHRRADSQVEL